MSRISALRKDWWNKSFGLTLDENDFSKRQQTLNLLYRSLEVSSIQPKGALQIIDQVSALKPIPMDNSRIKVPVDTWLTIRAKEKSVVRHVRVMVIVYHDSKGAVAVGWVTSGGDGRSLTFEK